MGGLSYIWLFPSTNLFRDQNVSLIFALSLQTVCSSVYLSFFWVWLNFNSLVFLHTLNLTFLCLLFSIALFRSYSLNISLSIFLTLFISFNLSLSFFFTFFLSFSLCTSSIRFSPVQYCELGFLPICNVRLFGQSWSLFLIGRVWHVMRKKLTLFCFHRWRFEKKSEKGLSS